AFLDQDDLWLPERLARSVDELRNAPELGMVVTNTLIQDERRGIRTPHWRSITKTGERITKRLIRENFICTPGTMVRIDVLKAVGLFDEGYYGVDDFDLWYRIARVYDIGFIEEPLAVWRYHAESLSGNVARMLEDVLRFYDKVLELEEHEEELAVAKTRRREILFSLGVVQSLAHEDTAARETFKEVVNGGVPSLKAAVAIRLHAFSPGLFRVMRSLLGSGRPAWDQGIPTNLEVVV
ncbi:MAG: hypothetical protein M1335_02120, partial [Chloroflexi bacterium]|nr:hypothetical protein [Chloroflexota bacterium]